MTQGAGFPMKKWRTVALASVDPRISDGAFRLLVRLMFHHNNGRGQCNPSQKRLSFQLGVSERTIRDRTRCLERAGLLDVEQQAFGLASNQYNLRFFEGDTKEFQREEYSCLKRRKKPAGKQKKEQKKGELQRKSYGDGTRIAPAPEPKTQNQEVAQEKIEKEFVKLFSDANIGWSAVLDVEHELAVLKLAVSIGDSTPRKAAEELLAAYSSRSNARQ